MNVDSLRNDWQYRATRFRGTNEISVYFDFRNCWPCRNLDFCQAASFFIFFKNRIFSYLRDSGFVCISYDFLLVYIFSLFFRFSQCCLAFQGWITHRQHIILMCEPCRRQLFSVILWIKPHMHRVTQHPAATKGSENWRLYPFPNPHSTRLETAFTSEVFLSWD